jgi:hypothetical protein
MGSTQINRFDRPRLKELRRKIEVALSEVGAAEGIDFSLGGISFSDHSFTVSVKAAMISDGISSFEQVEWNQYCRSFGLEEEDFGKSFRDKGSVMTIVGIKPRSSKYPIIVRDEAGKQYKMTLDYVQFKLERKSA